MPEEGLRRGRGQQTSGLPQRQGDCQVVVLQAGGQPGRMDGDIPLGPGGPQGEVTGNCWTKCQRKGPTSKHSKGRDVRKPSFPSLL